MKDFLMELIIKKLRRHEKPWVMIYKNHIVGDGNSPEEAKGNAARYFDALAKESLLKTYEGHYPGGAKTAVECMEKMAERARRNAQ